MVSNAMILDLGPITSNSQKKIKLISFPGFCINANFSLLTDCGQSFISVERMYYVTAFLIYYTVDGLGYYVVLVQSQRNYDLIGFIKVLLVAKIKKLTLVPTHRVYN